jgi:hypothetical protein
VDPSALDGSRALWNRDVLDLRGDEVLAQLLDRGEPAAWRELYRRAKADGELRARLLRIIRSTPLPLPRFWLALLAAAGETVDFDAPVPPYADGGP